MKFKIEEREDGSYQVRIKKFGSWLVVTTSYDTADQARAAILDNVKSAEEVSE